MRAICAECGLVFKNINFLLAHKKRESHFAQPKPGRRDAFADPPPD